MRRFFIYFSLFVTVFLASFDIKAQETLPTCVPTVEYHDADTLEWRELTSSASGSAPISVRFYANPKNLDGWVGHYEWRFTREDESTPFMVRYDEDTEFEFTESKAVSVKLHYQFTRGTEVFADSTTKYTVTAYESKLLFPNAFSPNGDDHNPVYKAKTGYRSIIEFHAYIYNRWGTLLYEWTEPKEGWDGTYKGKDVKEGVYFVLVKAKGADGRKFLIKKDVNLLRGYNQNASSSSGGGNR